MRRYEALSRSGRIVTDGNAMHGLAGFCLRREWISFNRARRRSVYGLHSTRPKFVPNRDNYRGHE
jgi:hypothetical protein